MIKSKSQIVDVHLCCFLENGRDPLVFPLEYKN